MARKKEFQIPEHAGSGRVGLMVFRGQPWHRGHDGLYTLMNQDCDERILGFGSTQLSGVVRHPFTFEQRLTMPRILHGDSFKPLQLVDIDSGVSTDDWVDYVLDKIAKLNMPEPTDYYSGSVQDAKWYVNRFARLDHPSVKSGPVTTYTNPETGKRLHILDRAMTPFPAAEEIRSLIERRDDEWKDYVPARLVPYIEWHYPPHLRVALSGAEPPDADSVPVGTRWADADRTVFVLHDDGKWRKAR